jgi:hypothetical protein
MRGVDIANQIRSSYPIQQKTKHWYMSMFYWYVESALINAFAYFHYQITNENFVSHNTNLVFRSAIIYNFIGYALGFNVNKGILAEQPIRTRLNTLDNFLATCVVNAFHLPVRKTKGKCQWCWLIKEKQY